MSNRKQVGEGRLEALGAPWRAIAGTLRHCLLASALACAATAAPAADPSQYTEAERQLFVRPHLAEVAAPTRLHYHYERTGTLQPEATDHATLTLSGQGGGRTAAVDYLSGDRRLELPTIDYVEQNPIILHFLEREVRQMKELTGGAITFYRNRIRKALAGEPKVRETEFEYGGRKVKGVEIRIDPYRDDPARSRFEKFVDRYYVMVLSPEIPGEVYQLRAELPSPADSREGGVVHREVLTFDREDRGG